MPHSPRNNQKSLTRAQLTEAQSPMAQSTANRRWFPAVEVIFVPVLSALWVTLHSTVSMFFYVLREHFRSAMERAIILLGHVLLHVAVMCAAACIITTGLGSFASYTCSLSVLSRLSVCHDIPPPSSDPIIPYDFPTTVDPHTRTYEKVLDEFARGAPLALNLMKTKRLVVELMNEVEVGPLSYEFKHEFRTMFSTFDQEAQRCQTELEILDSAAVGSFLQFITSNKLILLPEQLPGGPPKSPIAWGAITSFSEWLSKRKQAVIPMATPIAPEPLDFSHTALQVSSISHRLQRLQNVLVDLHRLISVENAQIADEEKKILVSWILWGKKSAKRQRQLSQTFLSMIDLRRKEGLAYIDGIDNSLRSYQLDMIDLVSTSPHDSRKYQFFRLQHSIQRLGHQPLLLPQLITRDAVV